MSQCFKIFFLSFSPSSSLPPSSLLPSLPPSSVPCLPPYLPSFLPPSSLFLFFNNYTFNRYKNIFSLKFTLTSIIQLTSIFLFCSNFFLFLLHILLKGRQKVGWGESEGEGEGETVSSCWFTPQMHAATESWLGQSQKPVAQSRWKDQWPELSAAFQGVLTGHWAGMWTQVLWNGMLLSQSLHYCAKYIPTLFSLNFAYSFYVQSFSSFCSWCTPWQ